MDELNIIIPVRCQHAVKALADGERGRLMLGIVDYCVEGREPGFTGGEKYLWPEFKAAIDEQREKDIASKRARAEAGRLGGLAKLSNAKQCYNDPPSSPFESPNNPPKKRVSKDTLKESPPAKRFTPPSVDEVAEYCTQRNNGVDAETFVNFYESKGWLVGKVKMKDWKAAVRTWERSRKQENTSFEQQEKPRNKRRFVSTGDFEGYWEEEQNGKWVRI